MITVENVSNTADSNNATTESHHNEGPHLAMVIVYLQVAVASFLKS